MPPFGPWPGNSVALSQLAGASGNSNQTGALESFQTDELDLTVAQTVNLNPFLSAARLASPALWYIRTVTASILLTTVAGSVTTGFTWHAGNNAAANNLAPVNTPSAAALNAAIALAAVPVSITAVAPTAPFLLVPITTPHSFVIDTGAVGVGLTLKGKMICAVQYVHT